MTATINHERQELKAANKQLAEWDAELNQLHERNGDLGLKVQMLEQELKEVQRDREANKKLGSDRRRISRAGRLAQSVKSAA
ncbi:hypothetical protein [Microcoleus sp. B9-D4]|uniref:hypothetical protein n=1 Tax=Microcoleus sp. B9-D4 TaxID=2818711 RepID=UPI002FD74837